MIKEATHNECFAVSFARACEYLESTASSHRDPTVHSCNLRGGDHRSASSRAGLTTYNSSNTVQTSMPHRCLLGKCGNNEPALKLTWNLQQGLNTDRCPCLHFQSYVPTTHLRVHLQCRQHATRHSSRLASGSFRQHA